MSTNKQNPDHIHSDKILEHIQQTDTRENNSSEPQPESVQDSNGYVSFLTEADKLYLTKNKNKLKILVLNNENGQEIFEFAYEMPHTPTLNKDHKKGQTNTDQANSDSENHLQSNSQLKKANASCSKTDGSMENKDNKCDKKINLVKGNLRLYKFRTQDYFRRMKSYLIGSVNQNEKEELFGDVLDNTSLQSKKNNSLNASNKKSTTQGKDHNESKKGENNTKSNKNNQKSKNDNSSKKKNTSNSKNTNETSLSKNNEIQEFDGLEKYLKGNFLIVEDLKKEKSGILKSERIDAYNNQIIRGGKNHRVGMSHNPTSILVENWKEHNKICSIDPKPEKIGCGVKCDIY